jgi:hypothetical protein
MKLSAAVFRLVKLHRPPPEIAIFFPMRSACSSTTTLRPRFPASIAQKSPAAPPPITTTSVSCTLKAYHLKGRHEKKGRQPCSCRPLFHEPNSPGSLILYFRFCRRLLFNPIRLWRVVKLASLYDIFFVVVNAISVYIDADFKFVLLAVVDIAGVKRKAILAAQEGID